MKAAGGIKSFAKFPDNHITQYGDFMITKEELLEILRESPMYYLMDEIDLAIIVQSLHEHIATQNK